MCVLVLFKQLIMIKNLQQKLTCMKAYFMQLFMGVHSKII